MMIGYTHADNILEVDLGALVHNYQAIRDKASLARCAAVVKANAYGIGVEPASKALYKAGCRDFFVASVEEGIELRTVLPDAPVYVFYGVSKGQEAACVEHRLIPVLNDLYQIELWQNHAKTLGKPLPAIIHIDTGMCRLGMNFSVFETFWADVSKRAGLEISCVMSHLACADDPEHYLNVRQLHYTNKIKEMVGEIPVSLANSNGIYLDNNYHFQMVRPGISLYGANPLAEGVENPMRDVVTIKARILQVRQLDKKETVGYGATYEAKPGTKIAVIAAGYADGYMRSLSNAAQVYVGGKIVPMIGRVSMDLVMIDVTNVPETGIHPGAEVELLGKHIKLGDVAKRAGTIEYELLTNLGRRYRRVYKGS